jgi:hypothetical protein
MFFKKNSLETGQNLYEPIPVPRRFAAVLKTKDGPTP